MLTVFNPDRTTSLLTEGTNMTAEGLGLSRFDFDTEENIEIVPFVFDFNLFVTFFSIKRKTRTKKII